MTTQELREWCDYLESEARKSDATNSLLSPTLKAASKIMRAAADLIECRDHETFADFCKTIDNLEVPK